MSDSLECGMMLDGEVKRGGWRQDAKDLNVFCALTFSEEIEEGEEVEEVEQGELFELCLRCSTRSSKLWQVNLEVKKSGGRGNSVTDKM